jgi:hypothetical protein
VRDVDEAEMIARIFHGVLLFTATYSPVWIAPLSRRRGPPMSQGHDSENHDSQGEDKNLQLEAIQYPNSTSDCSLQSGFCGRNGALHEEFCR